MRTMRKTSAALGSLVFFVAAPGVVAGLIPWWLTGWQVRGAGPGWAVGRVFGGLLLAAGAAVLVRAFVNFAVEGLGTPAPVAPTAKLVVGGLYRYVRNPMYVAVVSCIAGQALLLGRPATLWYAAGIGVLQAMFVRLHEEPALLRKYGSEYEDYRAAVPAWLPRLRPWTAAAPPGE